MKKEKTRKYVVIGTITIVLGILSFIVYQSYAYFKVNYTGNIINTIVGPFGSYEYAYTGSVQEFVVPKAGYYELELWGAQGGITYTGEPGAARGGYTKGTIYLEKDEILYIVVGDIGKSGTHGSTSYGRGGIATFNGGGPGGNAGTSNASYPFSYYTGGNSGGGATDIRLVNGAWNNSTSLRSRIMVAGGGGGSNQSLYDSQKSYGGNLIGQDGGLYGSMASFPTDVPARGKGGTQTSGGAVGVATQGGTLSGTSGQFGIGGRGSNSGGPYCHGYSGGGGGYYGGGGGQGTNGSCHQIGGGGSSSYISGYAGVNSIQETGGTAAQPLHTNNTLHYSGKYFINGQMEQGINTGFGKAKITFIGSILPQRTNTNLDNVRYIKSCSTGNNKSGNYVQWNEIQAIKDGVNVAKGKTVTGTHTVTAGQAHSNVTDGLTTAYSEVNTSVNTCVTVDLGAVYNLDEIGIFRYYNDGRIYIDNVLSVGETNVSGTTSLSMIIYNYPGTTGYTETSQGKRYTAWD